MATGNVSIRLSVQDAAAVTAALEKLGKDGAAALKKIEAASSKPGAGLTAVDKTVADLKGRIEETAKSTGVLGTFLTGLGPVGLAAAAGIGAAVAIIYEMNKAANELGARATAIVNFSEAVGFSAAQLQALNEAGSKRSLNDEQIAQGLQHLSGSLEAAHRATGPVYDDLRRIDISLAHQIAATKNSAEAYDILGRAIRQALAAGDIDRANALGRAAFGRNPGQQVNLAADIAAQGGINAVTAGYIAAGKALEDGLLKHLRELETENKSLEQQTKDIWASMFAADVLERANAMDRVLLEMAKHAKELHEATKDETWGQMFARWARFAGAAESFDSGAATEAVRRETIEAANRRRGIYGPSDTAGDLGHHFTVEEVAGGLGIKTGKIDNDKGNIYTQLDTLQRRLAALGDAATPHERLTAEQLKLNIALKEGNITLDDRGRKLAALNNAELVAKEGARERVGIASQEEIFDARMVQINKEIADGYIKTEAEKRRAIELTRRAAEDAFKAEQVRTSRTPGLTALGQFSFDEKAIDQVATRSLDNLDTTLVSVINHTDRAGDAWRKFGLSAVEAIEQATIKALILAPIARSMSGLLSGGLGGGGIKPSDFADGGIMTSRGPLPLMRYAGGGVATSPQLALFGEGRQNEAFVPLPDGRAIPAVLYGGNRGGNSMTVHGPLVSVTVHGATGDKAIEDAVHRGTQRALAGAAAIVKQYDRSLPARLADIQQRHG